jgi:hypothetical protein
MTLKDFLGNTISTSLIRIWVASTKANERRFGARVKSGLKRANGERQLKLTCKRKREVLWEIDLTGTVTSIAEGLMEIDDKRERPSGDWYAEHAPKTDTP